MRNLRFLCKFKKHDFECKFFSRKHVFELNFFVLSDFECSFSQVVSFAIKKITLRKILKSNNLPKFTTCTFHIAFLHIPMNSYRLRKLRQLYNSIRHRSTNTSCTLFQKDFHFRFRYGVHLSSLKLLNICKNQLLLSVKLQQLIQFQSPTCLTGFWERL